MVAKLKVEYGHAKQFVSVLHEHLPMQFTYVCVSFAELFSEVFIWALTGKTRKVTTPDIITNLQFPCFVSDNSSFKPYLHLMFQPDPLSQTLLCVLSMTELCFSVFQGRLIQFGCLMQKQQILFDAAKTVKLFYQTSHQK